MEFIILNGKWQKKKKGGREWEKEKERKEKLFMFILSILLQNCFTGLDEDSETSSVQPRLLPVPGKRGKGKGERGAWPCY